MPEKQLCGNCGKTQNEHFITETALMYEGWKTKFKPQILCGNCGKPKGGHDIIIIEGIKTYFCSDLINTRFEPAPKLTTQNRSPIPCKDCGCIPTLDPSGLCHVCKKEGERND